MLPARRLLLPVLAAAGAGFACQRSPEPVLLDLARHAALAERETPWQVVLFGTPEAEAAQVSGWVWAAGRGDGDGYAWAAARAELAFKWTAVEPRAALLDVAPYGGLDNQAVEVFLNDRSVSRTALGPARRRHLVLLPVEAQRAGRNVLRLAFAHGAPPQKPHRLRLAATVYAIAVGRADDPTLAALAAGGAPPLVSIEAGEGRPRLVQVGPGALRFAFRVPDEAELRVSPDVHPMARAAGVRAALRVTLQEEGGAERELWHGEPARGRRTREIRVPLGAKPGTLVRLGLHVGPPDGASSLREDRPHAARYSWAVWSAPRIVGRGVVDPLVGLTPAPPTGVPPPNAARLDALRGSLAGTNVLLILLDAAGARHFSCYGYERPTTPNVDRIAAEGVTFEEAYSPVGFTLLAMSSIWTSQLPDQHHNGIPYNSKLPAGAVTLAEVLSGAGVHTAGFVHNAFAGQAYGLDQGFREFDETYRRVPRAGAELFPEVLGPWLREHAGKPFFAYLHFREPHFPYNPPRPYDTLFGPDRPLPRAAKTELDWLTDVNWRRRTASADEVAHLVRLYDGNLRYADEQVGRLRAELEAAGLWDETVVLVTADHGDALHEHGFIGHLNQVYEDVIHVPLILRVPKGPAGLRVRGFVDLTDVAPTVADVLGALGAEGARDGFRGRSLLPMLFGATGKDAVVARTAEEQPKYAVRHGRFKYLYHVARAADELYDLDADPGEREDVASRNPVRTAAYRQALHRWILEQRKGPRLAAEEVRLTEEQRENLRALGYVQ